MATISSRTSNVGSRVTSSPSFFVKERLFEKIVTNDFEYKEN